MILSLFCHFPFGHDKRETDKRQTISWSKGNWQKTDNIMAKGKLTKDRQYHGHRETDKRQTISWTVSLWLWCCLSYVSFPLSMILSVFCQFAFGHDIVCLFSASLWPWYCLSFVSLPLRQYHGQRQTDKRQTISWTKGNWHKTDNIIAKGKLTKDRQYHGQREADKRQKVSWPTGSFLLAMILFVFYQLPFVHDIVCLFSASCWPWYFLSFVSFPLYIWQAKNHTGTKGQSMADKESHRDKRTIYGRQSTTQGQRDNLLPIKHHIRTKGQYIADKAPHRDKRAIYDRQSTTQGHLLSLCDSLSAIDCPFVPVWCFVCHILSFCPCVVLCLP
jgi:hypothetical protein